LVRREVTLSVVASVLSIVLLLVRVVSGIQKFRFSPMTSVTAENLGFLKAANQRDGVLEFVGAAGVSPGSRQLARASSMLSPSPPRDSSSRW